MKFSLRILLLICTISTLIVAISAAYLFPPPPRIPDCIGERLDAWQIESLTKRYKTDVYTDRGKATYSYENESGTCELSFWGNFLIAVRLTLPIDKSLNLPAVVQNTTVQDDSRTWRVSINDAMTPPRLQIEPSDSKWKEIRPSFPATYTVTVDGDAN